MLDQERRRLLLSLEICGDLLRGRPFAEVQEQYGTFGVELAGKELDRIASNACVLWYWVKP